MSVFYNFPAGHPVTFAEMLTTMKPVTGKVIPILPCNDIKAHTNFYYQLGFEVTGLYTSPNMYATIRLDDIELHFWGSRKHIPTANPSMCFIMVQDVEAVYNAFIDGFKQHTGRIPRSGIPRVSKIRDLKDDRRFTLTDPGGNTLFIGKAKEGSGDNFFRTLQNGKYAKSFAVLYDIVYSKEAPDMAMDNLSKYGIEKEQLDDLDKAKYLLVLLDIQIALGQPANDTELKELLAAHQEKDKSWVRIREKYAAFLKEE